MGGHGPSQQSPALRVDGIRLHKTRFKHVLERFARTFMISINCLFSHSSAVAVLASLILSVLPRQTMSYPSHRRAGAPTAVRQGAPARLFGRCAAADEGPERSGGPLDLNRVTKVKTILKNAQSYILFRFCF